MGLVGIVFFLNFTLMQIDFSYMVIPHCAPNANYMANVNLQIWTVGWVFHLLNWLADLVMWIWFFFLASCIPPFSSRDNALMLLRVTMAICLDKHVSKFLLCCTDCGKASHCCCSWCWCYCPTICLSLHAWKWKLWWIFSSGWQLNCYICCSKWWGLLSFASKYCWKMDISI